MQTNKAEDRQSKIEIMETTIVRTRTIKAKQPHIATLKEVVSKALRQTWEYDTAVDRFEKAKHKHEVQLAARKQAVAASWEAVVAAANVAKGKYAE